MRRGRVFRRCTRCSREVAERRCRCGSTSAARAFRVDVAAPGTKSGRRQVQRGGFGTMAEAVAALNEELVGREQGTFVEPSKLTVGEYLTDWVAGGCGEVRPWTRKGYEAVVRVHVVPRIGDLPLQQLTREHLKTLYQELQKSGHSSRVTANQREQLEDVARRYRDIQTGPRSKVAALTRELGRPEVTIRHWLRRCRELGLLDDGNGGTRPADAQQARGLSRKSVHNAHIALRAAFNDAVEAGLLRSNPARGALKPPKRRTLMQTWTVEELRAFLDFVRSDRNFALYRLAAQSGMRRGELLGLKWADVKFQADSIAIQQQWTGLEEDEEDLEELSPTKSDAGRRAISLDALTVQALRDHRAAQEFERRSWGESYRNHDLVFARPDGGPQDPDIVSRRFAALVRRAGVKRVRFHDLRHTHATLLLEAGVDITVVSKRLGHASVKTTADLYAHVTARLQQDAASKIGALVDGPAGECARSVHEFDSGGVAKSATE